ncbi:MAG TPA: 30S ribosomal protein S7 [Nitrospinota bacterium]|jgi:small subunit ribosomal protein S7|nr:30S ribosomal protein S7 [Nitrospinota bacterium]
MSRRRAAVKRKLKPDPKFNEVIISQLTQFIMKQGKKSVAESIIYKSFDVITEKTKEDPLKVLKKAVDNVKPMLEVRSRRVGGATYQVPVDVRYERRISLALRWIVEGAKQRKEYGMVERLASELLDAYKNTGLAVKKKENTHKMAEANKAFAHYRW